MRFIFDSLVQYALALMPSGGNIEFLTKSVELPEAPNEDKGVFKRGGRCIQIGMNFTGMRNSMAEAGKRFEPPPTREEVLSNLVYRLVDRIVKKNQGMITCAADEKGTNYAISVTFPADRRKIVYYHLTDEGS